MPALLNRERELALVREQAIHDFLPTLVAVAESADEVEDEIIEVLRSPRVVAERFDRLQLEALERVDVMVRAPIVATTRGNQAEFTALKRGVRFRGLYDREGLEGAEIRPHLTRWGEAGEEIRVFPSDLPLKLASFDSRAAIMAATVGVPVTHWNSGVRSGGLGSSLLVRGSSSKGLGGLDRELVPIAPHSGSLARRHGIGSDARAGSAISRRRRAGGAG